MAEKKFVIVDFQACFEIDSDISQTIQSALDDLRSNGSARVTGFQTIEGQEAFDTWYHNLDNRINEMELPSPGTINVRID